MGEPHEITLSEYRASTIRNRTLDFGTWGSHGIEKLNVIFKDIWTDLTVEAIFCFDEMEKSALVPLGGGIVDVPAEATLHPLSISDCGKIIFRGIKEGVQIYSTPVLYTVSGQETPGIEASDATPSILEQYLNRVNEIIDTRVPSNGDPGQVLTKTETGNAWRTPTGGGAGYNIGSGLHLDAEKNVLSVQTAEGVEKDNTLPITSAAVYTVVGNIDILLGTI